MGNEEIENLKNLIKSDEIENFKLAIHLKFEDIPSNEKLEILVREVLRRTISVIWFECYFLRKETESAYGMYNVRMTILNNTYSINITNADIDKILASEDEFIDFIGNMIYKCVFTKFNDFAANLKGLT